MCCRRLLIYPSRTNDPWSAVKLIAVKSPSISPSPTPPFDAHKEVTYCRRPPYWRSRSLWVAPQSQTAAFRPAENYLESNRCNRYYSLSTIPSNCFSPLNDRLAIFETPKFVSFSLCFQPCKNYARNSKWNKIHHKDRCKSNRSNHFYFFVIDYPPTIN